MLPLPRQFAASSPLRQKLRSDQTATAVPEIASKQIVEVAPDAFFPNVCLPLSLVSVPSLTAFDDLLGLDQLFVFSLSR